MKVDLPWPNKGLSQNARLHWARKAKLTASHRAAAHALMREAMGRSTAPAAPIKLSCTFCPPDKRRRDRTNMIGCMKAYEDGIADALGVDDSLFVWTYQVGEPSKPGRVLVEVLA